MARYTTTDLVQSYAPPIALGLLALTSLVVLAPDKGDERLRAAFFPPWWSAGQILDAVDAAGFAAISPTSLPTLFIIRTSDADGRARLQTAGAWFTFSADMRAGCTRSTSTRAQ